jgi:hypothetical protein
MEQCRRDRSGAAVLAQLATELRMRLGKRDRRPLTGFEDPRTIAHSVPRASEIDSVGRRLKADSQIHRERVTDHR